jgi:thimet oligopeptidase
LHSRLYGSEQKKGIFMSKQSIECIILITILCQAQLSASAVSAQQIQEHNMATNSKITSLEKLAAIWPKTLDEIQTRTESAIVLSTQEVNKILALKDRTFENTVRALDVCKQIFKEWSGILQVINMVHPDASMRDHAEMALKKIDEVKVDLFSNVDLYHAVQICEQNQEELQTLQNQDKLLLKQVLRDFKYAGLHLAPEILPQVKILEKEILKLEKDFAINIAKDNPTVQVSREQLVGLNEDFINSLQKNGELFVLKVDGPTVSQIMTQCRVASTRKALFFARKNLAAQANEPILIELLKKRDAFAALLGYDSFAAYDLDPMDVKTVKNVEKFLGDIAQVAQAKYPQQFAKFTQDLPEGVMLNQDGTLDPWDAGYVTSEYKKKHYQIDEFEIAKYFPVNNVVDGIFEIYQKFLGLTFKKVIPTWVWHEDVILLEIYRTSNNELLGYLYLDLYPRPNKYNHACLCDAICAFEQNGVMGSSVGVIIANFPKPMGDKPALLKHADIITFFHEFGHAMHQVLSRTKHASHAGCNVSSDFVETPSQMFEEWMMQPEMLAKISTHYQTGESLPAALIEQKLKLRKEGSAGAYSTQCLFGFFVLRIMSHLQNSYEPSKIDEALFDEYDAPYFSKHVTPWYCSFGHIANDLYRAKYYTYLWTKVFAIDLFEQVRVHGYDQASSEKVVKLLSAGGSVEGKDLLKEFLGREPNQEAFFRVEGLK